MFKKIRYPVLRFGYLCALEKELKQSRSPEAIKQDFERDTGGWDNVIEKSVALLKKLQQDGVINDYSDAIKVKPYVKPRQCEGLITKCSKWLKFTINVGSQIVEVEVRLSLTICREPHLSKIWVSFVVRDGIAVNGSNPIIDSSKMFEGISDKLASIIRNKYQEFRPENIIEIHRLFIKAAGDPEILLKDFVNDIEKEEGYSIQKMIENNNEDVFRSVQPIISLSFDKEPGNINDYISLLGKDQIDWAIFQTMDKRKKGLFIKRHDLEAEQQAKTVFAGAVCGGIDDALDLTRSIIRTLAPFL